MALQARVGYNLLHKFSTGCVTSHSPPAVRTFHPAPILFHAISSPFPWSVSGSLPLGDPLVHDFLFLTTCLSFHPVSPVISGIQLIFSVLINQIPFIPGARHCPCRREHCPGRAPQVPRAPSEDHHRGDEQAHSTAQHCHQHRHQPADGKSPPALLLQTQLIPVKLLLPRYFQYYIFIYINATIIIDLWKIIILL